MLTTKNSWVNIIIVVGLSLTAAFAFGDLLDDELEPDLGGDVKPVGPDTPAKKPDSDPDTDPDKLEDKVGDKIPKQTPQATVKPQPKTKTTKTLAPTSNKTRRKEQEKKEPVKYQSNGLTGLRDKGTIELKEDVVVSQGTLKLEADQAKIEFDNETDEVKVVTADGHIKMFRYDKDSGERIQAFGDKVTFLNDERKIILEGNARLFRGPNLMRGNRLVYELDTGWIRAEKVEGELHPEKDK